MVGQSRGNFSGKEIACELARYAASLVRVKYRRAAHLTDLEKHRDQARKPKEREGMTPPKARGDATKAFADAAVRIDAEYRVPVEHHNPMELFGATVVRDEDGKLIVYDKTQGVQNVQQYLCKVFKLQPGAVRVMSPYMGGGFGAGLRPQYQVVLAVLGANALKRPVRVMLTAGSED